jgi:hypothetical protein
MEHPIPVHPRQPAPAGPARPMAAPPSDRQACDLRDEERSEDDGMREHADKASDPLHWAACAAGRSGEVGGPARDS